MLHIDILIMSDHQALSDPNKKPPNPYNPWHYVYYITATVICWVQNFKLKIQIGS